MAYANISTGDKFVDLRKEHQYQSDEEILNRALRGSPGIMHALTIINAMRNKPEGRKKTLMLCHLGRSVAYVFIILAFMGVKVAMLDSTMTPAQRDAPFDAWNNDSADSDSPEVLISAYALQLAGLNGQKSCCTVLCLEPALSIVAEEQADCRVRRWSQSEVQEIHRIQHCDTYMDHHAESTAANFGGIAVGLGYTAAKECVSDMLALSNSSRIANPETR